MHLSFPIYFGAEYNTAVFYGCEHMCLLLLISNRFHPTVCFSWLNCLRTVSVLRNPWQSCDWMNCKFWFWERIGSGDFCHVSECCLLKNEIINLLLCSIPVLGISYLVPSTHQRCDLPWSRLLSVHRDNPCSSGSHDSLLVVVVLCLFHSTPTVLTPDSQRQQSFADNGLQGGNVSKAVTGPGAGSCEHTPSTTNSRNTE